MEHNQTTMDIHSKKLDFLNRQLIEAGLKTPPESSDSEDDASPSDVSSEAKMQTEENEGAQDEDEDEEVVEGETSTPMDDGGAEATAASKSTGIDVVGVEEEDDGDVTKVENPLLDTPPPPNPESIAPDSMDSTRLESQTLPVEDRLA